MMKIAFGTIGTGKSRLKIQEDSWLPEELRGTASGLCADLCYWLKSVDAVALEGELIGTVMLECSRCGDSIQHDLKEDFHYLVTTREEEISELPEHECSDEECDTLYLKEPVVDVAVILQEQLYLALPSKVLCSSGCKGLCPECGISLNRGTCVCHENQSDSPFAVLKKLKKD